MIEFVVGSKNPTKLRAVELAVAELLMPEVKIHGFTVESGVSDQPMSDEEMLEGALNRAKTVAELVPHARYAVGMEGGMRVLPQGWFDLGWVCVLDIEKEKLGYGATPAIAVPEIVQKSMETKGLELSDAVAEVYGTDTVTSRDCTGVLTGGLLPADRLYSLGILSAFATLSVESEEIS